MRVLTLVIAYLLQVSSICALEISVNQNTISPLGHRIWVRLAGPIEPGDGVKFFAILQSLQISSTTQVSFELDSPGGSVIEAMTIGRHIASLPHGVTTTVGGDGIGRPGECASACLLAFLGGHYRFLEAGSRIGVHQFYFTGDEIETTEAASLSQSLSAEIVSFLTEMRADPNFFQIMANVPSENMFFVPEEILVQHRVINGEIFDEREEYKNSGGNFYLLRWQQSRNGENKMAIGCNNGTPVFIAFLQPPEVYSNDLFLMQIDGDLFEPEHWEVVFEGRWVEVLFRPSSEQMQRIAMSRSFGAIMMPPSRSIFFGFDQVVRDTKLYDTITNCRPAQSPRVEPLQPNTPGQLPQMRVFLDSDFRGGDLLPNGLRGVTFEACMNYCLSHEDCRAVTWVEASGWCWPKHTLSQPKRAPGLRSAIRN